MRKSARHFLCSTLLACFLSLGQTRAIVQGGLGNGIDQHRDTPNYIHMANFVIVISPRGNKVASYNVQTKKTTLIRLSEAADTGTRATPIVGSRGRGLPSRGKQNHEDPRLRLGDRRGYLRICANQFKGRPCRL